MTAIVYGLLSIATGVGITMSTIKMISWNKSEMTWRVFVSTIIFTVPILLLILTFFNKSKSGQSIRVLLYYIMIVLGGSAIFGAAIYGLFPDGKNGEWICFFGLGGGLLFLASLGFLLYEQIYKVRKGDYSIETYYHLWRLRLDGCPLMTGKHIYKTGQKPGIGTYKCLKCPKGGQEIKNDGIELGKCDTCGHSYFYDL